MKYAFLPLLLLMIMSIATFSTVSCDSENEENQGNSLPASIFGYTSDSTCLVSVIPESQKELVDGNWLNWFYLLVAPYPTTHDSSSSRALRKFWLGEAHPYFNALAMTRETFAVFTAFFGAEPAEESWIPILPEEEILPYCWQNEKTWALIPFEAADPRWKTMRVDGSSPFTIGAAEYYPLAVKIALYSENADETCEEGKLESNFLPEKLTSVTLTGTTAMVRNLSFHIEIDGLMKPIENIRALLSGSDILHISNEVSFSPDCPPAVPLRREARFCSDPSYFAILDAIGTDIVELTGNHNLDWGIDPYIYSLNLYREKGIPVYGGGMNVEEGQKAALLEHHGNKIAFLGCNAIGPENILATSSMAGAAPCDLDKMKKQVESLKSDGYIVIVTFQHLEYPYYDTVPAQTYDFYEMAAAGADIVSGSQAHIPQGMAFVGKSFIHFGLGNLLFDQMSDIERDSFFDRHYIYDGKYIGNILETIRLENYSQPRFLRRTEREKFLSLIFGFSSWAKTFL